MPAGHACQRYRRLLDTLATTEATPRAAGGSLAEIVKPFRKLRKAVAAAGPDPADEVLHELRIRGKKLRYAAELAGGKPVRRLVKATKRLQDVLGEHQDACVAEQRREGRRRVQARERRAERGNSTLPRRSSPGGWSSGNATGRPRLAGSGWRRTRRSSAARWSYSASRFAAASTRSSVAVSATRTCLSPAGP